MSLRHVKKHWKKYLAGQVVGVFLLSYITKKHRSVIEAMDMVLHLESLKFHSGVHVRVGGGNLLVRCGAAY